MQNLIFATLIFMLKLKKMLKKAKGMPLPFK